MSFNLRTVPAQKTVASVAMVVIMSACAQNAQAYERWICISNVGSSEIVRVQISHVDKENWGPNLIRGGRIDVGDVRTVEPRNTQGYCRFDIKVTYADGEVMKVWRVNLCAATDLVINEYDYNISYV